ncbi:MAG: S9 family peptidase [Candidatus Aminicenantales bacterium]
MEKKLSMKAFAALLFISILRVSLFAGPQEPIRGKALYEKLLKDKDLIKFEGLSKINWTPDGQSYYVYEDSTFKKIDAASGKKSSLFPNAKILAALNAVTGKEEKKLPFKNFESLNSGRKIRFAAFHKTFIYDLATGKMVVYEPEKAIIGVRGRVYNEVLSPNCKYRAFTRNYNLYIKDLDGNEAALTANGHEDLRNGFPDWVYPEELNQYDAFWWSPDSKKITYMQFDESPVAKYPIVHDVSPVPELELQSYPKSGANNPIIRFFIVDIATHTSVRVDTGDDLNVYLCRGAWSNDGREFFYQRLNRLQNLIELFAADPVTGKSRVVLKEEDPCYIDEGVELVFLKDSQHFLWTSERTGWKEIYLYDLEGKLVRQLTDARLPVGNILGVDEESGWVYFTGYETRGLESHLYRVRLDGTGFARLTKEPGSHSIDFSPGFHYYVDSFSSFNEPRRVTLHQADGKEVRGLGESAITQAFRDLKLIPPEHFTFQSADGKHDLDAILYKPAHFNEGETYPLILSVYGGPGSKRVFNRFLLNDSNQALAQLGFIVVSIDHRGISRRGKAFQNLMYMNLGEIELADHVAVVKHLAGSRPYVDGNRVGIFGHSYGGYLTCMALLKAPDIFHVGVAGAPVTDWRNYDTIYTERFMRRPPDNPEGYTKGSCLTYADNLKGRLFIHHGSVDDNVHLGNTIHLIEALLKKNKKFDFMIYPEQRHGITFPRYGEARVDYFVEHLKPAVMEPD